MKRHINIVERRAFWRIVFTPIQRLNRTLIHARKTPSYRPWRASKVLKYLVKHDKIGNRITSFKHAIFRNYPDSAIKQKAKINDAIRSRQ